MLKYLLCKARSKGYDAWIEGNHVSIKMMIAFFGHDKSYSVIQVSTVKEYRALMGDD